MLAFYMSPLVFTENDCFPIGFLPDVVPDVHPSYTECYQTLIELQRKPARFRCAYMKMLVFYMFSLVFTENDYFPLGFLPDVVPDVHPSYTVCYQM